MSLHAPRDKVSCFGRFFNSRSGTADRSSQNVKASQVDIVQQVHDGSSFHRASLGKASAAEHNYQEGSSQDRKQQHATASGSRDAAKAAPVDMTTSSPHQQAKQAKRALQSSSNARKHHRGSNEGGERDRKHAEDTKPKRRSQEGYVNIHQAMELARLCDVRPPGLPVGAASPLLTSANRGSMVRAALGTNTSMNRAPSSRASQDTSAVLAAKGGA